MDSDRSPTFDLDFLSLNFNNEDFDLRGSLESVNLESVKDRLPRDRAESSSAERRFSSVVLRVV